MNSKLISFGCLAALIVTPSIAQAPDNTGEVVMKTNIGSFKITSPGDKKSFGKITMSFKGSLLIVGYDGKSPVSVSGNLRTEYENKSRDRVLYFGQGTVTLDGKFHAIQWFGRNLTMNWNGMGICRLYGEFDKEGNTGTYSIKGDVLRYWGNGGTMFTLPAPNTAIVTPKVRKSGG